MIRKINKLYLLITISWVFAFNFSLIAEEIIGDTLKSIPVDSVVYPHPIDKNRYRGVLLKVPSYRWSFGCAPTAGAMVVAYYDRSGYPQLYTGPTNGGKAPMGKKDDAPDEDGGQELWGGQFPGDVPPEAPSFHQNWECPISATCNGIDGNQNIGHVDDYYKYVWAQVDPLTNQDPNAHHKWDCLADFMGTSMWDKPLYNVHNLSDGDTYVVFKNLAQFKLTAQEAINVSETELKPNQLAGLIRFLEYRKLEVDYENTYTQWIDEGNNGFTYEQFKIEINNGRPVLMGDLGNKHAFLAIGWREGGGKNYFAYNLSRSNDSYEAEWGVAFKTEYVIYVPNVGNVTYTETNRINLLTVLKIKTDPVNYMNYR